MPTILREWQALKFKIFYWKLQSVDKGYNITCQTSICFEKEHLVLLSLFFYNSFCILISVWVFSNKSWFYSACNMPIVIVSTMGRQCRQTFNPISNLWAISKILKLRFPHYILLFVITLFTADTKEKKNRDVPNKKLFQIHSCVFTKPCLLCFHGALFAN